MLYKGRIQHNLGSQRVSLKLHQLIRGMLRCQLFTLLAPSSFTVLEPRLVYAEGIRLAKPGLVADRENFSAINFIYRPKRGQPMKPTIW